MAEIISNTSNNIYTSKELSWLAFNERVLQEACDTNNPLIERIRFLGIFASNLDEFFQVRFANLKHKLMIIKEQDSLPAKEIRKQLAKIQDKTEALSSRFDEVYSKLLLEMAKHRIFLVNEGQLSKGHQEWLSEFYKTDIKQHIFPIVVNESLELLQSLSVHNSCLIVQLLKKGKQKDLILLPIPNTIQRFIVLPKERYKRSHCVMLLDNALRFCLDDIFNGYFDYDEIKAYSIRITRDAEYDLITEAEYSLLEMMSTSVKQRITAQPVRFLYEKGMPASLLKFLKKRLNISSLDSVEAGGRYLSYHYLLQFPDLSNKTLVNKPLPKIIHHKLHDRREMFKRITESDILLYYPYHSFSVICELLRQASFDPLVTSIKINLYRVAKNSRIIDALINAVNNGKNVTVVIELQARFDEEANISWAKRLTDEDINVVFSTPGFKIHSKLFVITRKEGGELVDYAHIGTGNFNESTAKIYTDFSLLTKRTSITEEVKRVFRFIEMPYSPTKFKHLLVSPINVRDRLEALIEREIRHAQEGKKSGIKIKINNLVDLEITNLLYKASQAGVRVDMIIRGMCSLRPGVKGISDNIHIISVVDRFLEHPRIYCFENDGDPAVYLSSADWMTRNLDRRIEVGVPIIDPNVRQTVLDIMEIQLKDNVKARIIDAKERNKYVKNDKPKIRSQIAIHEYLANKESR